MKIRGIHLSVTMIEIYQFCAECLYLSLTCNFLPMRDKLSIFLDVLINLGWNKGWIPVGGGHLTILLHEEPSAFMMDNQIYIRNEGQLVANTKYGDLWVGAETKASIMKQISGGSIRGIRSLFHYQCLLSLSAQSPIGCFCGYDS